MECGFCTERVSHIDELLIFKDVDNSQNVNVYVNLDIEKLSNDVHELRFVKKDNEIYCKNCEQSVGTRLRFSFNNTHIFGFACGNVSLNAYHYKNKGWHWNCFDLEIHEELAKYCGPETKTIYYSRKVSKPVQVLSLSSEIDDFEWRNLLLTKKPYKYQIEAYVEGMLTNLVIPLGTGYGKTLIASMIFSKMRQLNQDRIGLLIVDRIPLAYQQTVAIASDTGLLVASVCSENKSELTVYEINSKTYDIVVATAGSLRTLLSQKKIDLSFFHTVIFDECHHITGKHAYVSLMKAFTSQNKKHQPRIIGLSASPFILKTRQEGEKKIKELNDIFPDLKFFQPENRTDSSTTTLRRKIETSQDQKNFVHEVVALLNQKIKFLSKNLTIQVDIIDENLSNLSEIRGQIRKYFYNEKYSDCEKDFKTIEKCLQAIEECIYIGVPNGVNILLDEPYCKDLVEKFRIIKACSTRIEELTCLIDRADKCSKILVFVDTRSIARSLHKWAESSFKDMNPQLVVGHNGLHGMTWDGEQSEAIRKFSTEKSTNLLISTSVLDEGIDVASCDLVIAFNCTLSLIRFIQMRGRARKENAKFFIFESELQKRQRMNTDQLEELIKSVLKATQRKHSKITEYRRSIVKTLSKENEDSGNYLNNYTDTHEQDYDLCITLYVDNSNHCGNIKDRIRSSFKSINCLKVLRLTEIASKQPHLNIKELLSDEKTKTFLMYVAVSNCSLTPPNMYKIFCSSYSFTETDGENQCKIFSKECFSDNLSINKEESQDVKSVECQGYATGCFKNPRKLNLTKIFNTKCNVEFTPNTEIKVTLVNIEDGRERSITVKFNCMKQFAFVMYDRRQISLIMTLNNSPIFSENIDSTTSMRLFKEEDQICFSQSPVFVLYFDIKVDAVLNEILLSKVIFPANVFNTKFDISFPNRFQLLSNEKCTLKDQIIWEIDSLVDSRKICCIKNDLLQKTSYYFRKNESPYIRQIIVACLSRLRTDNYPYFTDVYSQVRLMHADMENSLNETYKQILEPKVPSNNMLIKRVIVTPTRIIASSKYTAPLSRLLRYTQKNNIDIVNVFFRDEDLSTIHDKSLVPRFKEILNKGFKINNDKYFFLLSTGSQFRHQKGYFVKAKEQSFVNELRHKFIPNYIQFPTVAKYLARLGMYGTADNFVCQIFEKNINFVEDIYAKNGDMTTDGAGLISISKAKEIKETMNLSELPSAFQIRFGGCKGVLVTVEDDHPELDNKEILIRASMRKFKNNDNDLCIVAYSKFHKLFLNREIINLISCITDFDAENKLLHCLDKDLEFHIATLIDELKSKTALSDLLPNNGVENICKEAQLLQDPYWFELLRGMYRLNTNLLKSKMKIYMERGALLIGIPDPYGVLKEDQISVQISKKNHEHFEKIESNVLIFRNPCLHPGDFRVVSCVYHEKLAHFYNVVVFPSKNCDKSIAAQCSGGDLDGDRFAIIWDENLIPPVFKACEYKTSNDRNKTSMLEKIDHSDIADFVADLMTSNFLGKISNLHLALCDVLDSGAADPKAIVLAEAHAVAVDYPKMGLKPIIPANIQSLVQKYPDFMEKKLQSTYESFKPLGVLYRKCLSTIYNHHYANKPTPSISQNHSVVPPQRFEDYLEEAEKVYILYSYQMNLVISQFNLVSETDVVLANATYGWNESLYSHKSKISESIKQTYNAIREAFREIFFQNISDEEEQLAKAYAWYYLVYDNKSPLKTRNPMKSFAWILSDVLSKLGQCESISSPNINVQIGKSLKAFLDNKILFLQKSVHEKNKIVDDIRENVDSFMKLELKTNKTCFKLYPYGSTSVYLNETESDIDICVIALPESYNTTIIGESRESFLELPESVRNCHFIKKIVEAINLIATEVELPKDNHSIQFAKLCVNSSNITSRCDISMNKIGLMKTHYIHHLYKENPLYFIILFTLVAWARAIGLVKNATSDKNKGMIATSEFYALVINILEFPPAPSLDVAEGIDIVPLEELQKKLDSKNISINQYDEMGQKIIEFFKKMSTMTESFDAKWPVEGIDNIDEENIPKNKIQLISNYAKRSLHCLMFERNIEILMDYIIALEQNKDNHTMNLGSEMALSIGKSLKFFEGKLSLLSNSDVHLSLNSSGQLILNASATKKGISTIKKEINKLKYEKASKLEEQFEPDLSVPFVKDSYAVIPPRELMPSSRLKFSPCKSAYDNLHQHMERTVIFIDDQDSEHNHNWEEWRNKMFLKHILDSVETYKSKKEDRFNDNDELDIQISFGCLYFLNTTLTLPMTSIPFEELGSLMERSKKPGYFKQQERYFGEKNAEEVPILVPSPSAGDHLFPKNYGYQRRPRKRRRLGKTGLDFSFNTSLFERNVVGRHSEELLKDVYRTTLQQYGFHDGLSHFQRPVSKYIVSVDVSQGSELLLYLSETLDLEFAERNPQTFVGIFLLSGERQESCKNIRTNIDTTVTVSQIESLLQNSSILRHVLLENNEIVLPIYVNKSGKIVPNRESKFRNRVLNVQEIEDHLVFTDGSIDAIVKVGKNLLPHNSDSVQRFCDLTFHFHPHEFIAAINLLPDEQKLINISQEMYNLSTCFLKVLVQRIRELKNT